MADDVGALLVRAGLISERALDRARAAQRDHGGTVAERLVEVHAIDDESLTRFLAAELELPRVPPEVLAALPEDVRRTLPAELAAELRAVPVALGPDGALTVAVSDPLDVHTLERIGFFTSRRIVRALCTQGELAWCLAHYYDQVTDLGRALSGSDRPPFLPLHPSRLPDGGDFGDEETGVTGPMRRIHMKPVQLDELAPRSGEFTAMAPPTDMLEALPAVLVEAGASAAVGDEMLESGPLDGRRRRATSMGVGRLGGKPANTMEDDDPMAPKARKTKTSGGRAKTPRPVDDGWEIDAAWGAPGNTIPPEHLRENAADATQEPTVAASPAAAAAPTHPLLAAPTAEAVAASADRLLGALRALDDAATRDGVIDVALGFVTVAAPRAGFAARKGDALESYLGPGAALGATLAFDAGPMIATLLRAAPFRGPVVGHEARFASSLLAVDPEIVAAVPLVVRAKLVGAFFAEATAALVDEHVAVVARATGIALERVLKQRKS